MAGKDALLIEESAQFHGGAVERAQRTSESIENSVVAPVHGSRVGVDEYLVVLGIGGLFNTLL